MDNCNLLSENLIEIILFPFKEDKEKLPQTSASTFTLRWRCPARGHWRCEPRLLTTSCDSSALFYLRDTIDLFALGFQETVVEMHVGVGWCLWILEDSAIHGPCTPLKSRGPSRSPGTLNFEFLECQCEKNRKREGKGEKEGRQCQETQSLSGCVCLS